VTVGGVVRLRQSFSVVLRAGDVDLGPVGAQHHAGWGSEQARGARSPQLGSTSSVVRDRGGPPRDVDLRPVGAHREARPIESWAARDPELGTVGGVVSDRCGVRGRRVRTLPGDVHLGSVRTHAEASSKILVVVISGWAEVV